MVPRVHEFLQGKPFPLRGETHQVIRPKPFGVPRIEIRGPLGQLLFKMNTSQQRALEYYASLVNSILKG